MGDAEKSESGDRRSRVTRGGRRLAAAAAVAATCLVATSATSVTEAGAAPAPALHDAAGLTVTADTPLNGRLLAVTVTTAALPAPADVRILLPTGYAAHPHTRYPVLYLLDGTSGTAADWTTMGNAQRTTAGLPMIVVMPDITLDGNGGGWCTNWVNDGAGGPPEWETFHIDQLIPWVDDNLRTVADRGGRAIEGVSQGGFCAMSYAAQYPDMFSTAQADSGAPDIAYDPDAEEAASKVINYTEVALDQVPPYSMFGDPALDQINWAAHDPTTLADNLRGMNLFMFAGNGLPGSKDPDPVDPEGTGIEALIHEETVLFHDRLDALDIPSSIDLYGSGTHSWPYWSADLASSIHAIMGDFAHPPAAPASVTYTSADPQYAEFGWRVSVERPAEEFSTLESADTQGFSLAGSGSATVVTPPSYRPGGAYSVSMSGVGIDTVAVVTADVTGHLTLTVPLGTGNPYPQFSALAAGAGGTTVYTTSVQISSVG